MLKDLEARVQKNEGEISDHDNSIKEILEMLANKADKADLDALMDKFNKLMKEFQTVKDRIGLV